MHNHDSYCVVVVIATSNRRTDLLLTRALRSVYSQCGVNPHHIYIVDDNEIESGRRESGEFSAIRRGVKALRNEVLRSRYHDARKHRPDMRFDNFFHTSVMPNARTRGKSGTGAWNTAALHALQYRSRRLFMAVLDDDDEWTDDHLASCLLSAKLGSRRREQCVAVVSGIKRIESDKSVTMTPDKKSFTVENIFAGNPGFQGSNIFVELKTFWSIGGFDESMDSGTDRDLAIRLLDHVRARSSRYITYTGQTTVVHHAESAARVTANHEAKRKGLDAFYRKYWHRFGATLRDQSLKRAERLFGYRPSAQHQSSPSPSTIVDATPSDTITPFNLHIGFVSDNSNNTRALLQSFLEIYRRDGRWLSSHTIHILDNSDCEYELKPIANYFTRLKNLNIETLGRQSAGKLMIDEGRTRLQRHILKVAHRKHGDDFVAWIVDDDHLFCADINGEIESPPYFTIIAQNRRKGIDGIFGMVSDAPPLPFISTIRTQLLDFHYNLENFAHCDPKADAKACILNRWQQENEGSAEFYYDLSDKCFQHLERPFYWTPHNIENRNIRMHEAFKEFLAATAKLADGVNVFRKITFASTDVGEMGECSVYRGGNTIIYTPAMLDTPNYTPDKNYNRRSDFNWAIINTELCGRELRQITLPLQHNRNLQSQPIFSDVEKFRADVRGMLFYRLLQDILQHRTDAGEKRDKKLLEAHQHRAKKLLQKLKACNYRTMALCHDIEKTLEHRGGWWYRNEYRDDLNHLVGQNLALLRMLKFELGKRKLQKYIKHIESSIKVDADFISHVRSDINKLPFN